VPPFQAVRDPVLRARLPQPAPAQVRPQHSGSSVSCLSSSLLAMLIAVLCSHFMLSNGDLAIFNTANQQNRSSSLSRAPFCTASLAPGSRAPRSRGEQPAGGGFPQPRSGGAGGGPRSFPLRTCPAPRADPSQGGANSLFSLSVPCRCVRGLSSQWRFPEQRGQFAEAPSWRHFHPAAAGSFRSSF